MATRAKLSSITCSTRSRQSGLYLRQRAQRASRISVSSVTSPGGAAYHCALVLRLIDGLDHPLVSHRGQADLRMGPQTVHLLPCLCAVEIDLLPRPYPVEGDAVGLSLSISHGQNHVFTLIQSLQPLLRFASRFIVFPSFFLIIPPDHLVGNKNIFAKPIDI